MCWVAAELILEPLGLDRARPFVVIFTLLGFPLALVLAWAYEVTPEGIRRDPGTEGSTPPDTAGASRPAALVATRSRLADEKSIAVLPFVDMSADGDQEYFGDGMAEELLNAPSRLPGLRVAARTATFAFKGRDADVHEIGSRLSVRTVLEGSIRKSGDRVRVTAQLIDATTGYHTWSETYQRELEDVFTIHVFFETPDQLDDESLPLPNEVGLSIYDDMRADPRFDRVWALMGVSSPPKR